MAEVTDLMSVGVLPAVVPAAVDDRRRPGRLGTINHALLPLLREPQPEDTEHVGQEQASSGVAAADMPDGLAPARGVFAAVVISVPLWLIVIGGFYLLF
jgi:hypothetical protein